MAGIFEFLRDSAVEFGQGVGTTLKDMAQSTARLPETIGRSLPGAQESEKRLADQKLKLLEDLKGMPEKERKNFLKLSKEKGLNTLNDILGENVKDEDIERAKKSVSENIGVAEINDPVRKALYGTDKIKTVQKQQEEGAEFLKGVGVEEQAADPLAKVGVLGLLALDAPTGLGGAAKKGGKDITEALIKAKSEEEVRKALKGTLDDKVAAKVAPAIATVEDPHIIKNIIQNAAPIKDVPTSNLTSLEGAPDAARVAEYRSRIENGGQIEPLLVNREGDQLIVEDGKHRLEALRQAGIENAPIQESTPGLRLGEAATTPVQSASPAVKPENDIMTAGKPQAVPTDAPEQAKRLASATQPQKELGDLDLPTVKRDSLFDKAFRSASSRIRRQGESGAKLADTLSSARDTHEVLRNTMLRNLPSTKEFFKKGGDDVENFGDIVEGRLEPTTEIGRKFLAEWQATAPQVRERALSAGLDVGNIEGGYFPHLIQVDDIFKDKESYNTAVKHLVETNQAADVGAAEQLLADIRDEAIDGIYSPAIARPGEYANLEKSRTIDLPFYDKSAEAVLSYVDNASKRISYAENFGPKYENALDLLKKVQDEGGDARSAKEAFDQSIGAKKYSDTASRASQIARQVQATTKLGLSALTNSTQSVNTAIVSGYRRTIKGIAEANTKEGKEFADRAGVVGDRVINDVRDALGYGVGGQRASSKFGKFVNTTLPKVTAPAFKQVESFNRTVAAVTGRIHAQELTEAINKGGKNAAKAEAELRNLGVTGDIGKTLTPEQEIQAARTLVERTQFKVDAQDLPLWASSPLGRVVSQFRTFSYKQQQFLLNEVIKPMAKDKDIGPLARLMIAIPTIGATAALTRDVVQNKQDVDREDNVSREWLNNWQKVGGGGLVTDIPASFIPREGDKLPPQVAQARLVGAALGPSASTGYELTGNLTTALQGEPRQLARQGVRSIPFVGSTAANTIFPYSGLSDRQEATLKVLQDEGAPKEQVQATKSFYTTLGRTSSKYTKANDAVNEAIAAGDLEKAKEIATEFNKELAKSFEKWTEKYGDYSTPELTKEYNAKKIKLTAKTLKQRRQNISENPLYAVE